ncbi:MAG: fasciclin domain-containing protein [Saprospiraceae bacterium]|nr:fasciclin domain-containing protein [Saprospiraceae bacterium]
MLSGDGPFTVFAPTDAAFAALPEGTIDSLLNDIPALTAILTYHVVGTTALSGDLIDGQIITTLNGTDITVTINANGVFINNAQVTVADIIADNGVVHVIDAVLLPPAASNTVVDIIVNSPDHNTLEAAVIAADLADVLSGDGPFTVFAPTDAAFAALPEGVLDALLSDPQGALTDILLYHVVDDNLTSTDIFNLISQGFPYFVTLNGKTVTITASLEGAFINNAKITVTDIIADNGIVHVIDAVLIAPDSTIIDVVRNSDVHNILELALDSAGVSDILSGYGPFTLFAPTDAAFEALPEGTIEALLQDPEGLLSEILAYHVIGGSALSTDLFDSQSIITLAGKPIKVTINNEGIFINDAKVIIADIVTDNGVVHVIDAVLIPKTTVMDVIDNSPDHFFLSLAIDFAGLRTTLNGDGPFTVFAPTDEAIEALPEGLLESLIDDPDGALRELLLNHVTGGAVGSSELTNGQIITMAGGQQVTVTINNDGVFINNAKVIVADLLADNGIVHVIDAVLLPEEEKSTVWDIISNSSVHNTLTVALSLTNLDDALQGDGPFTVFAPTDEAFDALPAGTLEALIQNPTLLSSILLYHVTGAQALSGDLVNGQSITTLNGQNVNVTITPDGVFINEAKVIIADLVADNGVVHVLDAVLSPPSSTVEAGLAVFNIYPNPTSDFIKITFDSKSETLPDAEVIDISGNVTRRFENVISGHAYNISELNSGLYILRMNTLNGSVVRKFIKK